MDKLETKTNKIEHEPSLIEIERKFLVDSVPFNLEDYPSEYIVQGYLLVDENFTEVRIRREGDKCIQTVKMGVGESRLHSEVEIEESKFDSLWEQTEGRRIEKIRYNIPCKDKLIELDVYKGKLEGLVCAEVEFSNKQESNEFEPPFWFGKEVTFDQNYKNQNLAHGIEQERIQEYSLKEGVDILVNKIRERLNSNENIIVAIAGGSASGKTSAVANSVFEEIGEDALILSTDDYYRGVPFMESEAMKGNILNWDQPEALDLDLLKQHLLQLKEGKPIQKPIYDMKTGYVIGSETVYPKKVVITEGLFVLDDMLENISEIKTFVSIGTHGRVLRRLLRDVTRTGQAPADILKYFSEVVEPMHEKYIEATKKNADFVINNEYIPKIESERSGMQEIQLKFRGVLDKEFLRQLGAERLGLTFQVDHYYDPKGEDLSETDEIVRIREEGSRITLGYKGPERGENDYRQRSKFEFEIDEATKTAFLKIYGEKAKTIQKERTFYQFNGLSFSIDKVSKLEKGLTEDLGEFIEIRFSNNNSNCKGIVKELGLNYNQRIKTSYCEM